MNTPAPKAEPTAWLDEMMRTSAGLWPGAAEGLQAWQQGIAQMTSLWVGALNPVAGDDRRFAADAWRQDPRFAPLLQGYQQFAALTRNAVAAAPLDERSKAQWGFALRQVVDALSPANSLATNPEAMQTALGQRRCQLGRRRAAVHGHLAQGRISMTDNQAFELGRDLATTPGSVVFENPLMQLIQYAPTTPEVHKRPLVIIPPCINKFYILDLQPRTRWWPMRWRRVTPCSWFQAPPLDRPAGSRRRQLARCGAAGRRQLLAGVERVAGVTCRRAGGSTAAAGQHRVCCHRARPGALRQGEGGLNACHRDPVFNPRRNA